MSGWVYFFGDGVSEGDPQRNDLLGGKGASLAAMTRAGLPVPPGFTIATECCRLFLEGVAWPAGLEEQVRENLARLEQATGRRFGDGTRPLLVSVRSGAARSMPGMMSTILNCGLSPAMAASQPDATAFWRVYAQFSLMMGKTVADIPAADFDALEKKIVGDDPLAASADQMRELVEAYQGLFQQRTGRAFPTDPWKSLVLCIETVFQSWNTERAVAFRQRKNITGLAGTAVTVQAMFPSQVSGVAFTTNPNDPDAGELIIESSFGMGEAIVSGDVHPDHFAVGREDFAIRRRVIGHKTHVAWALGDTQQINPDAPSLTDDEVGRLAALAMKVEQFFGRPMDTEWGIAGGQIALLQSRPISLGGSTPQRVLEETRRQLQELASQGRGPWARHNLSETLPHPTTLTWSVIGPFMSGRGGFGRMYRQAGFEPSAVACERGFLELLAGRVYMDASLAAEMLFENYPFRYDLDLLRSNPDAAQSPPTIPTGTLRQQVKAGRRIAAVNRRLSELAGHFDRDLSRRIIPEFVAWCAEEKARDLGALSGPELAQLWLDRHNRVLDKFAPQSLLPSLIAGMAVEDLRAFVAEHFWQDEIEPEELAATLATPAKPDRTMRANAEMYALSLGQSTAETWLARHGHRASDEFDLASPRWREQPAELLSMAAGLKDGADPMQLHRTRVHKVRAEVARLRERLGRRDRADFDRRLQLARRYVVFREDGKDYLMLGYDLLRDLAVEAGKRLGLGDDAFWLTADEMLEALGGCHAAASLSLAEACGGPSGNMLPEKSPEAWHQVSATISQRKALHQAQARVTLPHVIDTQAIDSVLAPAEVESADSYPAFAVSAGLASGPAWVVQSRHQASEARSESAAPNDGTTMLPQATTARKHGTHAASGYILVCPSTDPSWTPLFVNAAGLVMECGGTLSHGAIVAREMGIPAVVLQGATRMFADGEMISIDGQQGRVYRNASPAAQDQIDRPAAQADDADIPFRQAPPPPSRREWVTNRVSRYSLLAWGVYLLATFCTPDDWLYQPSLRVLDVLFWPLVTAMGRPLAVAAVATGLAVLTMVLQRLLTDNTRLREARLRTAALLKSVSKLKNDSPRALAVQRLVGPARMRVFWAAMAPMALLLGPMVMIFAWMPVRADPASWNAAPGSSVAVTAGIDGGWKGPVTLTAGPGLEIDPVTPATQTPPPLRDALEAMLSQWKAQPASAPWDSNQTLGYSREQAVARLSFYLSKPLPPIGVTWQLHAPEGTQGRFPVTLAAGDTRMTLHVVLGNACPPCVAEAAGDGPLRSARIVYPPASEKRVFWAPVHYRGQPIDLGWLGVYLLAYLPAVLLSRWILRVA